jgi:hypothetical protein
MIPLGDRGVSSGVQTHIHLLRTSIHHRYADVSGTLVPDSARGHVTPRAWPTERTPWR